MDSDEGLKAAAKLFQQSAGIFSFLKSAAPALGQEPTPDLSPDTLHVLSSLMLAQAQEIFVLKAIKDAMKVPVIAKLASQAEEMYADSFKAMQKDSLKALWDRDWITLVSGTTYKSFPFMENYKLKLILLCRKTSWIPSYRNAVSI